MLKVNFVGAVNGVSGSCSWLHHTATNTQFLVDCGAYQGGDEPQYCDVDKNHFPFQPEQINFVLLTHAHLDHCGLLPEMVEQGFTGKVYATRATKEIAEVMLRDALKINGGDLTLLNGISWSVVDEQPFKWGQTLSLTDGLKFTFLRSSHILGAVHISIAWKEPNHPEDPWRTIMFSGDIGCNIDGHEYLPLLKSEHYPYPQTDYLVVESTYGSRPRDAMFKSREQRLAALWRVIDEVCLVGDGILLIPAFSLHRTQELMCDIWQAIELNRHAVFDEHGKPRRFEWCVHSPLGHKISKIYSERLFDKSSNNKHMYLNDDLLQSLGFIENERLQQFFADRNIVTDRQIMRKIDTGIKMKIKTPADSITIHKIIIASSGMCNAGPVVEYLELLKDNPQNAILLTGYQAQGTAGHSLLQAAGKNQGSARLIDMSGYYSAHADQNGLLDFVLNPQNENLKKISPLTVFINHGSDESKLALQDKLRDTQSPSTRKINNTYLAKPQWFDLDTGKFLSDELLQEVELTLEQQVALLSDELRDIKSLLRQVLRKLPAGTDRA